MVHKCKAKLGDLGLLDRVLRPVGGVIEFEEIFLGEPSAHT